MIALVRRYTAEVHKGYTGYTASKSRGTREVHGFFKTPSQKVHGGVHGGTRVRLCEGYYLLRDSPIACDRFKINKSARSLL